MQQDVEQSKRYTRVMVDSKDRNRELFPNPNIYEITLEDDIDDVVTAELLSVHIPMSQYMINTYYNTFEALSTVVTIPVGDYSPDDLALVVTSAMGDTDYKVSFITQTDNYVFRSKHVFTLKFDTPLAKLFGFDTNTLYTSTATGNSPWVHEVKAPFRKDFDYNNYIIMCIDQFDINKSTSTVLTKSFAIITKDMQQGRVSLDSKVKKRFNPPLPRLQKIRVKFYDRYGNPYNFSNMDHHFEVLFESYKQKRKYQNIFLNR